MYSVYSTNARRGAVNALQKMATDKYYRATGKRFDIEQEGKIKQLITHTMIIFNNTKWRRRWTIFRTYIITQAFKCGAIKMINERYLN